MLLLRVLFGRAGLLFIRELAGEGCAGEAGTLPVWAWRLDRRFGGGGGPANAGGSARPDPKKCDGNEAPRASSASAMGARGLVFPPDPAYPAPPRAPYIVLEAQPPELTGKEKRSGEIRPFCLPGPAWETELAGLSAPR